MRRASGGWTHEVREPRVRLFRRDRGGRFEPRGAERFPPGWRRVRLGNGRCVQNPPGVRPDRGAPGRYDRRPPLAGEQEARVPVTHPSMPSGMANRLVASRGTARRSGSRCDPGGVRRAGEGSRGRERRKGPASRPSPGEGCWMTHRFSGRPGIFALTGASRPPSTSSESGRLRRACAAPQERPGNLSSTSAEAD